MAKETRQGTKRWLAKWVFLAVVGLCVFLGVKLGWVGLGWAMLKSATFPRDDALLEWAPEGAPAIVILDPHQLPLRALGAAQGVVGESVERIRADIKKVTGVDLAFDVDKLVLTPSAVILRGRFAGDAIAAKLAAYRYTTVEYKGYPYLVRAGEDALLIIENDVAVYGDEASIKASIDAKFGASLSGNEAVIARLSQIGWGQAVLGTVRLSADRPSLRSLITGAAGPRAVSFGVRAGQGVDLHATIEVSSASSAEELAKLLDEKRPHVEEFVRAFSGARLSSQLAGIAKTATIMADAKAARVDIRAHVPGDVLAALLDAAQSSPEVAALYKSVRLYQLLAPSL